jgi:hypothetical protein
MHRPAAGVVDAVVRLHADGVVDERAEVFDADQAAAFRSERIILFTIGLAVPRGRVGKTARAAAGGVLPILDTDLGRGCRRSTRRAGGLPLDSNHVAADQHQRCRSFTEADKPGICTNCWN